MDKVEFFKRQRRRIIAGFTLSVNKIIKLFRILRKFNFTRI